VAIAVGVQMRVNVGAGDLVTVGEIVAVEILGGAIVDVDGPVVGIRVIVPVGEMIGLGGISVVEGLVGLAGGCVGGRLVGLSVFVLASVGEGATVCVTVATRAAANADRQGRLVVTPECHAGPIVGPTSTTHPNATANSAGKSNERKCIGNFIFV